MSTQLHITNGDMFTKKLKSLNIKGDIITWREMLCEGQTLNNVGSESFWKTRFDFLNKNYKISKATFVEKTLKEYRSLCNHKQQDQIVLWFGNDLFCQINLLAVVSWLKSHRKYAEISLVVNNSKTESFELDDLSTEALKSSFENRTVLTQDDIEYADYIWQLYCSDNPIRLENLTNYKNYSFKYLPEAITAHLKRFPTIKNGLNSIENNLLHIASNKKIVSKKQLLETALDSQKKYGFGDLQHEKIISSLRPLFSNFNPVRLTKKGKEILEGKTNYYSFIKNDNIYLGGALKYNFLYNSASDRILKL